MLCSSSQNAHVWFMELEEPEVVFWHKISQIILMCKYHNILIFLNDEQMAITKLGITLSIVCACIIVLICFFWWWGQVFLNANSKLTISIPEAVLSLVLFLNFIRPLFCEYTNSIVYYLLMQISNINKQILSLLLFWNAVHTSIILWIYQ